MANITQSQGLDGTVSLGRGTRDHSKLFNRNIADQHQIESITNLREELDDIKNIIKTTTCCGLYQDVAGKFGDKSVWYMTSKVTEPAQGKRWGVGDPGENGENIVSGPYNFAAKMEREFITDIDVGHLTSGTTITEMQTIKDVLYKILCEEAPQPTIYRSFYKESATIPQDIDDTWTKRSISESVKTEGLVFKALEEVSRGYVSFAYSKDLDPLTGVFQNNLPFNILSNWKYKETTFEDKTYYMYYFDDPDPVIIEKNNILELSWNKS